MDDRRFDTFTRALAAGRSRRQVLRVLMSLGAVASGAAQTRDTHAARRSYSGPSRPTTAASPRLAIPPAFQVHAGARYVWRNVCLFRWTMVARNPCDGVTPPRAEQVEMDGWTAEEANAILAATSKHSVHAIYLLALSTGMRQG